MLELLESFLSDIPESIKIATEMIAEIVLARSLEATGESIIKTVHAHPTLSESVMEAAANAYGEGIHI